MAAILKISKNESTHGLIHQIVPKLHLVLMKYCLVARFKKSTFVLNGGHFENGGHIETLKCHQNSLGVLSIPSSEPNMKFL